MGPTGGGLRGGVWARAPATVSPEACLLPNPEGRLTPREKA